MRSYLDSQKPQLDLVEIDDFQHAPKLDEFLTGIIPKNHSTLNLQSIQFISLNC